MAFYSKSAAIYANTINYTTKKMNFQFTKQIRDAYTTFNSAHKTLPWKKTNFSLICYFKMEKSTLLIQSFLHFFSSRLIETAQHMRWLAHSIVFVFEKDWARLYFYHRYGVCSSSNAKPLLSNFECRWEHSQTIGSR